jgi:hypothetical protein
MHLLKAINILSIEIIVFLVGLLVLHHCLRLVHLLHLLHGAGVYRLLVVPHSQQPREPQPDASLAAQAAGVDGRALKVCTFYLPDAGRHKPLVYAIALAMADVAGALFTELILKIFVSCFEYLVAEPSAYPADGLKGLQVLVVDCEEVAPVDPASFARAMPGAYRDAVDRISQAVYVVLFELDPIERSF